MTKMPAVGIAKTQLFRELAEAKAADYDWRRGKSWSLVYYGGEEHSRFLQEVYGLYFSENGLSSAAFPSLGKLEREVVAMVAPLLSSSQPYGTMTSGGTESILLAIKAYRDWNRVHRPEVTSPEILVAASAHPAFLKAGEYFGVRVCQIPLGPDYRVDADAAASLIRPDTIAVIASAPCYPYGTIDPIEKLGAICSNAGVGLHVDACLGGFLLPFLERIGYSVKAFDFRVPGVTSISTDLHKNGYTAKGASVVLYRDPDLFEQQFFVSTDWSGGLYGSPTMLGTRPGGAIAAAWAAIMTLGEEGYNRIAAETMAVTTKLMEGIRDLSPLSIVGVPDMSVFAVQSNELNIFALADRMEATQWRLDRQRNPDAIHMIATPNHAQAVEPFLSDLRRAVEEELANPLAMDPAQQTALYGVTTRASADSDVEASMRAEMRERYRLVGEPNDC